METHQEMKARHSKEFGAFEGIFFAFSNEQLAEGMIKIGLAADDFKNVVRIGGGGFLHRDKVRAFKELFARHNAERKEMRKNKKKLFEALVYELSNHEYCITRDPLPALESLGMTLETVPQNVLKKAIKKHNEEIEISERRAV